MLSSLAEPWSSHESQLNRDFESIQHAPYTHPRWLTVWFHLSPSVHNIGTEHRTGQRHIRKPFIHWSISPCTSGIHVKKDDTDQGDDYKYLYENTTFESEITAICCPRRRIDIDTTHPPVLYSTTSHSTTSHSTTSSRQTLWIRESRFRAPWIQDASSPRF